MENPECVYVERFPRDLSGVLYVEVSLDDEDYKQKQKAYMNDLIDRHMELTDKPRTVPVESQIAKTDIEFTLVQLFRDQHGHLNKWDAIGKLLEDKAEKDLFELGDAFEAAYESFCSGLELTPMRIGKYVIASPWTSACLQA